VIASGPTERQATVTAPLAKIAETVRPQGLAPPALIVAGEVVTLRRQLRYSDDAEEERQ
jgi:siroheme synthase